MSQKERKAKHEQRQSEILVKAIVQQHALTVRPLAHNVGLIARNWKNINDKYYPR